MKKTYLVSIVLLVLMWFNHTIAQQLPVYSQFMYNKQLINPAAFDEKEDLLIKVHHRSQWVSFEGAPVNQTLSGQKRITKKHYGIGGHLFNDIYGPVRNTGINLNYNYHMRLADSLFFSLGLAGAVYQYYMDRDKMRMIDETDMLIPDAVNGSSIIPDASFGTYLYHPKYYFGASLLHIARNKVRPFKSESYYANLPLVHHYYLMGGYFYQLNKEFTLSAHGAADYAENNIFHAKAGLIGNYKNLIELGAVYETSKALVALCKINVLNDWSMGYSYDFVLSKLRKFNSGSHEIVLSWRYNKSKKPEQTAPMME